MPSLTDSLREWRRVLATTVAAGIVAVAAIAVAGLVIPTVTAPTRTVSVPYRQQFSLRYSGRPLPGSIYGSTVATTGEPLYLASLEDLTMVLRYRLSSAANTSVAGTLTAAVVVDDQGLNQFVVAPRKIPVSHGAAQMVIVVPLVRYAHLMSRLSVTMGAASSYPIDVLAATAVTGTVAGRRIDGTAQASYAFTGTSTTLLPPASGADSGIESSSAGVSTALTLSGVAAASPAMLSTSSSAVTRTVPASHDVEIKGVDLPGMAVAWAAVLVAVAAGVAAVLLGRRLSRRWQEDPRLAVVQRLGSRAVALHGGVPAGGSVVNVERAEELRRLSRLLEVPILRVDEEEGRTMFLVHDGGYVYCYRVGTVAATEVPRTSDQSDSTTRTCWRRTEYGSPGAAVLSTSALDGRQAGDFGS